MTLCDCSRCGLRELRGARSVHAVPTPSGDVLALTCRRCGAVVTAATSQPLRAAALDAVA